MGKRAADIAFPWRMRGSICNETWRIYENDAAGFSGAGRVHGVYPGLQLALPVLVGLAGLIFSIVIGCCANRWYYRHTLRTARRIRAEKAEACAESELLAGGVNRPLGMTMLLCALIWSLFSDRILAVIIQLFAKFSIHKRDLLASLFLRPRRGFPISREIRPSGRKFFSKNEW